MKNHRLEIILGFVLVCTMLMNFVLCGLLFTSGALSLPGVPRAVAQELVATPVQPLDAGLRDVEEELVTRAYSLAEPAVVNIETRGFRESFFWGVTPQEGSGSGFVYDDQGHIVTNYHVIENASRITINFSDGTTEVGQLVGADPSTDLAVLQAEVPPGIDPLTLGEPGHLRVGQRAIAIGNPFGRFQRTLTVGVISALERNIEMENGKVLRRMIQTDAAINRGNSGGPLLDSYGRVIGVTSAIYTPTGGSVGVGLAIPVDTLYRVLPVIIEKGYYPYPWLGAVGYSITPDLADRLDLPVTSGILVARVYRDSPAGLAGIRGANRQVLVGRYRILIGGDIITAIEGQPVQSADDLEAFLAEKAKPGQTVSIDILRDGQRQTVSATLIEEPSGW